MPWQLCPPHQVCYSSSLAGWELYTTEQLQVLPTNQLKVLVLWYENDKITISLANSEELVLSCSAELQMPPSTQQTLLCRERANWNHASKTARSNYSRQYWPWKQTNSHTRPALVFSCFKKIRTRFKEMPLSWFLHNSSKLNLNKDNICTFCNSWQIKQLVDHPSS
jgi:hypothetical protein